MRWDELIEATLIRRYKRFLADVVLADERVVTVHCPNTGAMTGCAEPGSKVWLSTSTVKTRKYPHTWELVETRDGMACIHAAKANLVVREAFEAGLIPGFDNQSIITSEVKYGQNSRADLVLTGKDERAVIEVKSVTLCRPGGQGAFPDAVSARGTKHLQELIRVRDAHTRAVMLFCVFHNGVSSLSTAGDIDPMYRQTMLAAMESGVEILVWQADVSAVGLRLVRPLPFAVDPIV